MARPPSSQLRAIDLPAAEVDISNSSRIGNVVERVRIKHDEVGTLARCDHSEVIEAQDFGRGSRGRHKDLCRRHAGSDHIFQLGVHGPTDELIALLSATVGTDTDPDACGVELHDAAGETIPCIL